MTKSRNLDAKLYMCCLREVFKNAKLSILIFALKNGFIMENVEYKYDKKNISRIVLFIKK